MATTAWIVSRNPALIEELGNQLDRDYGCAVVGFDPARLSGNPPSSTPQWIFLDLQGEDAALLFEQLPALRERLVFPQGNQAAWIGIFGENMPLDWVIAAEVHLCATVAGSALSQELPVVMSRASERANVAVRGEPCRIIEGKSGRFVTYSPELFPILDRLSVAAKANFTVLLIGDTGTGKTTLARLIHEHSKRSSNRFLTVACGALSSELIESELFGHVKGAFTGAERDKEGKFDAAKDGTILLDEIDVLGMAQQAGLLRVLETGEFEPVGSNDTHKVNTRTIVASNIPLEGLIEKNLFRSDLYYRLNQVKFEIPQLVDRPRDIVPLAAEFILECCRENEMEVGEVSLDFLETLRHYNWPGNIRELRNEVRRAVLFSLGEPITASGLSSSVVQHAASVRKELALTSTLDSGLAEVVGQSEQDAIEQMLETQNFNRAATARALGISRVTLYNKIRKYRINLDDPPEEGKKSK